MLINRNFIISLLFLGIGAARAGWENPAVLCSEDSFPKGVSCLDLTQVKDPSIDFPSSMSPEERTLWQNKYPVDLKLCRNKEVLRREDIRPGTYTPLQIQIAWMNAEGGKDSAQKHAAVLAASKKHGMPPQALIGAITQESLLSSLGISPDGENYSCGIGQLNIQEWCQGVSTLTKAEVQEIGWPEISCTQLTPKMIEPFYKIARTRLGSRPDYRISARDFSGITLLNVINGLPEASLEVQNLRFKAITSFINNCQNNSFSILLKAHALKTLFQRHVPSALRNAEIYKTGETFGESCQDSYPSKYYPLHTGWLLAVSMYNAGPVQLKVLEHYYQVRNSDYPNLTPLDLIEALHWGGYAKSGSNRIYFEDQRGQTYSQTWYKSCVVQRHVARVIQHVTKPNQSIARSLEKVPCGKNEIPSYRRTSSGIKEAFYK